MINLSILISSSEVSGPGGLFDFDATLPLVAIQFLLLMVILNIILYNPLLTIIDERKEYILTNLSKASETLVEANKLTTKYEQELDSVRKKAQLEITNSQKIRKEYILTNLSKASETLVEANKLTTKYEQELDSVRKKAQLEITNSQKIHKEILEVELNISQKYIDNLLDTIIKDLFAKKDIALNSLDEVVQSLCENIETRLAI